MIELGLARVFRLLARTPLPWRALHVAGTNGKGSICAYISAMLSAYNASQLRVESGNPPLKHGRFTSPHLIDRWDCITIDEKTISESIFKQVEAKVIERNRSENIQATEFELLTATAFEIFTLENVDIGVIEVGMGGRLDSTNILGQSSEYDELEHPENFRPKPLVTAITTIALDHQGFLGNSLVEIATQKAGITKPGVPLVLALNNDEVTAHIEQLAKEAGVSEFHQIRDSPSFFAQNQFPSTPALRAKQQNGAMAYTITMLALKQLQRLPNDSSFNQADLSKALRLVPDNVIWPGRLQSISLEPLTAYKPLMLLDGAHNPESATVLANTVQARAGSRPVVWVLAASKGKDVTSIFKILMEGCKDNTVVATEFGPVDGMPWVTAAPTKDLKAAADEVLEGSTFSVVTQPDVSTALATASKIAEEKGAYLVVAGSLYLVGDVLRLIRDKGGKID